MEPTTTESRTIRRSYKFRCRPNQGTRRRAYQMMRVMGDVWCNACAERWKTYDVWAVAVAGVIQEQQATLGRELTKDEVKAVQKQVTETRGRPVSSYKRQYHLIRKREHPQYDPYDAQALQDVLVKLDGSFKSYWELMKKDPDARPPGQKRMHRCIVYRQDRWQIQGNILHLPKLGNFRVKFHRPIDGKIKTVSVTEKNGKWYACFSCEVTIFPGACGPVSAPKSLYAKDLQQEYAPSGGEGPEKADTHNSAVVKPQPAKGGEGPEKAGQCTLSFGNGFFLRDSEGREVQHPEFYATEIATVRRLGRSLSRKKLGSRNRRKARKTLGKWHDHIAAKRGAFLWPLARFYASNYQKIIVPKWPLKKKIEYAIESATARKLCDGAYGRFLSMLKQKAEEFGSEVIEVKEATYEQENAILDRVGQSERERKVIRQVKKAVKYGHTKSLKTLSKRAKQLLQGV